MVVMLIHVSSAGVDFFPLKLKLVEKWAVPTRDILGKTVAH